MSAFDLLASFVGLTLGFPFASLGHKFLPGGNFFLAKRDGTPRRPRGAVIAFQARFTW